MQVRLIDRAEALVVCSDWAAESAAQLYGRPRERFTVAPMGANFDHDPEAVVRPAAGPLRLLFVGFDWERKGGPLALAAFQAIRAREPGAEFHIVGCRPPGADGVPGVTVHGRVDKQDPAGMGLLTRLFRTSHFFIMPSRQEAYGLVYCEACAYGLPPVAAETGGVGTIVRHGGNGLLLPSKAGPADYAGAILAVWHDPPAYAAMQADAIVAYRERLNWRAWGAVLENVLRS
jgi:glycosyltransferase involved in cell wall biosynthesis